MYLAIDIGGTKTLLAVFDENGKVVEKLKFATPKNYGLFLEELSENVANLTTKSFIKACAAVPGRIDRENGILLHLGNLPWANQQIQKDISVIVKCPVAIENDANLAGLSEAHNYQKYNKVLYVTISTGIGGAWVVDGKLDPNTIDAEIGHTVVEHEGKTMLWESLASGSAIVRDFGKIAADIHDPKIWGIISDRISIGLYNAAATYTPEVIILGGGVGSHLPLFYKQLNLAIQKYKDDIVDIPEVVQAKNAEEAVIYGCYELIKV